MGGRPRLEYAWSPNTCRQPGWELGRKPRNGEGQAIRALVARRPGKTKQAEIAAVGTIHLGVQALLNFIRAKGQNLDIPRCGSRRRARMMDCYFFASMPTAFASAGSVASVNKSQRVGTGTSGTMPVSSQIPFVSPSG